MSEASCLARPGKRCHPPLRNMLIFYVKIASFSPCMIHCIYSWPETHDCTLSKTNFLTLPPSPVFENSLKLAWGPSNSSPWICILFLLSFPFFLYLCFLCSVFFLFFFSSCIFENGFGTCRLHFSFFSKSGATSFSLFILLLLLLPLINFFNYLISAFRLWSVANQCILR